MGTIYQFQNKLYFFQYFEYFSLYKINGFTLCHSICPYYDPGKIYFTTPSV